MMKISAMDIFHLYSFFSKCIQLLCQVDITERSIEHMMTYKTSHIPPTTNTHNFLISIKIHQTNLSMGKTMLTLLIQHSRKDRQTVFFLFGDNWNQLRDKQFPPAYALWYGNTSSKMQRSILFTECFNNKTNSKEIKLTGNKSICLKLQCFIITVDWVRKIYFKKNKFQVVLSL